MTGFLPATDALPLLLPSWQTPSLASRRGQKASQQGRPDRRVKGDPTSFVRSNLGLSNQQLSELKEWLDQNGTNWTIFLTQKSHDERYRNSFG
jgi:hypothetical protein